MANLDSYYKKWDQVLKTYDSDGEQKPLDVPKIDPKDISCHMGKPMTEEEFRNRTKDGARPFVVRQ